MKQRKRIQILLLVALSGLSTIGHAQGKACFGTAYEIKELTPPSDPSIFQWVENGQDIPNANAATYTIPATQPVGKYTYLRNSLKAGCEWASSNAYWVEVITCGTITSGAPAGTMGSFEDPRDNRVYKIVMMPDGKVWFAENLNYQKDLTFNQRADVANGVPFTTAENGTPAIGSFWCPGAGVASSDRNICSVYGALYTWETAMMVDGKWADETQMSNEWDELWVSGNYFATGAPGSTTSADVNNARGSNNIKGGGRGICPSGWHIPTVLEWAELLDKVEGNGTGTLFASQSVAGTLGDDCGLKLRTTKTYAGSDPGDGSWGLNIYVGTDIYFFSLLPAGLRHCTDLKYSYRGGGAYLWTSSARSAKDAARLNFYNNMGGANRTHNNRAFGEAIRCVQDIE
jgi:uncharacterized protein (TIGR02145 family)